MHFNKFCAAPCARITCLNLMDRLFFSSPLCLECGEYHVLMRGGLVGQRQSGENFDFCCVNNILFALCPLSTLAYMLALTHNSVSHIVGSIFIGDRGSPRLSFESYLSCVELVAVGSFSATTKRFQLHNAHPAFSATSPGRDIHFILCGFIFQAGSCSRRGKCAKFSIPTALSIPPCHHSPQLIFRSSPPFSHLQLCQ